MTNSDLDEHEATGSLFTRQGVNIHRSGCRNVHVFGGAAPRPCCGDYVIYWMCSTLPLKKNLNNSECQGFGTRDCGSLQYFFRDAIGSKWWIGPWDAGLC